MDTRLILAPFCRSAQGDVIFSLASLLIMCRNILHPFVRAIDTYCHDLATLPTSLPLRATRPLYDPKSSC